MLKIKLLKLSIITLLVSCSNLSAMKVLTENETDKAFNKTHPNIPNENKCCSLENYFPKTESQKEAFKLAKKILKTPTGTAAGLWLWGDVGLGKTHLSIAVAKAQTGRKIYFTQKIDSLYGITLDDYDTFIIDDINCLIPIIKNK